MADQRSLADLTADAILQHIVTAGLKSGDKLPNEKTLCLQFKVGRSTLREALRMLSSRNIVTVRHGSGIYISDDPGMQSDPLGFAFIQDKAGLMADLIEFRMLIEPRLAAKAAIKASASDTEELEDLMLKTEDLILTNQDHGMMDAAFHRKIADISGNSFLSKLEPIICQSINLFINISNRGFKQETINVHRDIFYAIRDHDPIAASDAMTLHIIYNRATLNKVLHRDRPEDPAAADQALLKR